MKLPIDVKDVMSAAADLEGARAMPLRVTVCVDPAAPVDLVACLERAFRTDAEQAHVDWRGFSREEATLRIGTDMCVLASGAASSAGELAAMVMADGVPVVTVTCAPDALRAHAQEQGAPLLDADVVGPAAGDVADPAELDAAACEALLKRLGEWIVNTFDEKKLAFALAFPFVRRPLANQSVNVTSVQNAGIGLVPFIPGADMPLMTMNQAKMVLQIAAAYDQELGAARWRELAAVCGGAFAGRAVARRAIAAVPVLGGPIRLGIGFAGTQAMGRAATAYFERTVDGVYELPDERTAAESAQAALQAAKARVRPFADAAGGLARGLGERASRAASSAKEQARPYVQRAAGAVVPLARQAVDQARPYVEKAVAEAAPIATRLGQTVAPAVQQAVEQVLASVRRA